MSARHRPVPVLITILAIFALASWNLWRAWIIAQQRPLLEQIGATLHPTVRLGVAIFWATLFLLLAVALWRRRPAVRIFLPLGVLLYGGYHLLLMAFIPAPAARQGWPLQLLAWAVALGWTIWVGRRIAPEGSSTQRRQPENTAPPGSPAAISVVQRGEHGKPQN